MKRTTTISKSLNTTCTVNPRGMEDANCDREDNANDELRLRSEAARLKQQRIQSEQNLNYHKQRYLHRHQYQHRNANAAAAAAAAAETTNSVTIQ